MAKINCCFCFFSRISPDSEPERGIQSAQHTSNATRINRHKFTSVVAPERVEDQQSTTNKLLAIDNERLVDIVETRFGLLDSLRDSKILNGQQYERIQSRTSVSEGVRLLLLEVEKLSMEQQEQFLSALDNAEQEHVTNYIRKDGQRPTTDTDNWPILGSHYDVITRNRSKLKSWIDWQNGLLDELYTVQCISIHVKSFVDSELASSMDRDFKEWLLQIILRGSVKQYKMFIDCLIKTKQCRVVALLEPDNPANGKPLDEQQISTLTANYTSLVELINVQYTSLLHGMKSAEALTSKQVEFIRAAETQSESNRRLLAAIVQGSQSQFDQFIQCLKDTGQQHVVAVLESGGVVAEMVATTPLTVEDENALTEMFTTLYRSTSPQHREELLLDLLLTETSIKDCQLIAMKTHNSIKLFFLCISLSGLQYLKYLYSNMELKSYTQRILTALLDNTRQVVIDRLEWDNSDYERCCHYFATKTETKHSQPGNNEPQVSSMILDRLSHKNYHNLFERLLLKAAGQLFAKAKTITARADVCTVVTLHTACRYWWETLASCQWNRRLLKKYFKHLCAPYRFNPKLIISLPLRGGCDSVTSVAELDGKLYAVNARSNTIRVLSIAGSIYSELEDITLPELCSPCDVVACTTTKSLYVACSDTNCIWRINLSSSFTDKAVEKFIVTDYKPRSMSVQYDRLLVTAYGEAVLHVYRCGSGDLLLTIELTNWNNTVRLRHAVETPESTVIVCHEHNMDSRLPDVKEVTYGGKVFRISHEETEFNDPCYLTMDSQKHILVCNRDSKAVVHFNRELKLQQVLLAEHQLRGQPCRLRHSEERARLYVSYQHLAFVDVYTL